MEISRSFHYICAWERNFTLQGASARTLTIEHYIGAPLFPSIGCNGSTSDLARQGSTTKSELP